jgi:hypothetical protein
MVGCQGIENKGFGDWDREIYLKFDDFSYHFPIPGALSK